MFKLAVASLALVLVTSVTLTAAKPLFPIDDFLTEDDINARQDAIKYRLPNETYPIAYKVHLNTRVDEADFVFTGQVDIRVGVAVATQAITIHALNLTVDTVALYKSGLPDTPIDILEPTLNESNDFLVITTATEQLAVGTEYILVIEYWSELREDEAGFYKASYVTDDGETR